jgi:hypothetical protein
VRIRKTTFEKALMSLLERTDAQDLLAAAEVHYGQR